MTNEIPVSLFLFMLIAQFGLLLYSVAIKKDGDRIDHVLTASISSILGWLNANLILNGNVNEITQTGVFVPIQSLPVHYFLLSVAIISVILVFYFVIEFFRMRVENEQVFSALERSM